MRAEIFEEKIFFPSKGKTAIRLLKFVATYWRTIPLQCAYALSRNKELVKSDFGTYSNTIRSLIFGKHNRNIFYHRMGRSSILYSWVLPKDPTIKLPFSCKLGRHAHFVHNDSCHLNAYSIGDDFVCYPHVVIGSKSLTSKGKPTIGNGVVIGTGAVIVGNITVGDNVTIAANAFVNRDIPNNAAIVGNPAIITKVNGETVGLPL